jgi:hypothetical protein
MKRRRKYILVDERLAAALAMLLPGLMREQMERERTRAKVIVGMFDFHHVVPHSLGGRDRWYNLTPMLRSEHRAETKQTVKTVAKVRRIVGKWRLFTKATRSKRKPKRRNKAWLSKLNRPRRWG